MNKQVLNSRIFSILIPVTYAIVLRMLFGVEQFQDFFSVMSVAFVFCVPFSMGFICTYFLQQSGTTVFYRIAFPVLSVLLTLVFTTALSLESWACSLMALPVFVFASVIGGLCGWYLKNKTGRIKSFGSIVVVLLPLLYCPVELSIGANKKNYSTTIAIDVDGSSKKIWDNVIRVKQIKETENASGLINTLNFPKPVKAELETELIGATRDAIFTGGLTLHETVVEYEREKKIVFSVNVFPNEIPSDLLDEHLAIGGKYFNIISGTYKLESLKETKPLWTESP